MNTILELTPRMDDPHLPLLASQAALEFDEVLLDHDTSLDAIKQLSELLQNAFQRSPCNTHVAFIDSSSVTVLGGAIKGTETHELKTVSDLAAEALKIATAMNHPSDDLKKNKQGLLIMRKFCIELSKSSAAYRQKFDQSRPVPPYHR